MKIRVHVILDELDRQIVEAIRGFSGVEIVQWDFSFDTAYQWTINNIEERVDVFLASEYAQVSNTDEKGKQIPRDKALLKRVRELFLARPHVKFVLLCDPERERPGNREFLTNLVTMGIYDFRTVDVLTEEMLEQFIKEPKRDISYVAEYLPGGFEGIRRHTTHDLKQVGFEDEEDEEEEEEEGSITELIKQRLIGKLKGTSKSKKGFGLKRVSKSISNEKLKKVNIERPTIKIPKIERKEKSLETGEPSREFSVNVNVGKSKPITSIGTIYALGVKEDKRLVNFKTWEQILTASDIVSPNVVVLSSDTENLIEKIKYLKENYDATIVVIGDIVSNEILEAGADDYFKEWDEVAYKKIVEDMGTRDFITGLYDRSYLDSYLQGQINLFHTQGRPFSILIVDIDSFEKIRNTYGHQASEDILIKFANFLVSNTRTTDVVIRHGGQKFIIVFPNTNKESAKDLSQMLRRRWNSEVPNITFSGGIAEFYMDGSTATELIGAADEALFRAKQSGMDKICAAGEKAESRPITLSKPGGLKNQVIVVVGAAPRVGATSFCLALAGYLSKKYPVEIVDAGGGAYDWVDESSFRVRKAPPLSVTPGMLTIIDAGHEITDEIQPYANMVFLVTDLSRNSIYLKDFIEKSNSICLIGNRGASLKGLKELGDLWGIKVLGTLSVDPLVKEAEVNGQIYVPRKWRKELQKVGRLFR